MKKVVFKLSYIGFNYQGLAVQKHTDNTIEFHLFNALRKLKLVQGEDPDKWDYSRSGRTDKGVSALGNVSYFISNI
jgi:tRNA pseudouridine38/39 synthase